MRKSFWVMAGLSHPFCPGAPIDEMTLHSSFSFILKKIGVLPSPDVQILNSAGPIGRDLARASSRALFNGQPAPARPGRSNGQASKPRVKNSSLPRSGSHRSPQNLSSAIPNACAGAFCAPSASRRAPCAASPPKAEQNVHSRRIWLPYAGVSPAQQSGAK